MVLALVLGTLVAVSCAYYAAALAAMAGFRRQPSPAAGTSDPQTGISVLKPAADAGPEFADLLRSHAAQDYPDFEILVGIAPGDSVAAEAACTVRDEFPALRIEIVECPDGSPGCNGKAEVLARLAERAEKPVWVVTDADIRVPSHYLRTVCADLDLPGTGLVTCLYRGEAGAGLASRLEAVRIDTEFPAQVLVARSLQGMRFALGSTLAFRRETLARLGGFQRLRGFVGDDYVLGAMVASEGLTVDISSIAVSTQAHRNDGPAKVWERQLRWARTIRKQRPAGHAGLVVTFATVWCCAALLAQPSTLWPLATAGAALRLAAGAMSGTLVKSKRPLRNLCLLPAADLAAFAIWICSYFGNTVSWGSRRLRLGSGGRILH